MRFDYQSDRHCAKTVARLVVLLGGLITSQIDTAPKHYGLPAGDPMSLITSQIDTAPKQAGAGRGREAV